MTTAAEQQQLQQHGLYDPANEHDACGVGFVAHIKGEKRHDIVTQALKILENIDHRGAVGADALMGDGAGILIQLPDALYREEMAKQGVALPPAGEYGVGFVFLPKEHASRLACEQEMERAIKAEGQVLLGWRDVPVNKDMPMSESQDLTSQITSLTTEVESLKAECEEMSQMMDEKNSEIDSLSLRCHERECFECLYAHACYKLSPVCIHEYICIRA